MAEHDETERVSPTSLAQLAPAAAVFGGLFALPLAVLFVISFWTVKSFKLRPDFTFAGYERLLSSYRGVLVSTILIGLAVALICVAIGFVFAYAVRFKTGRFADLLIMATLITMFGGYLAKVYAWKSILGADGIINSALIAAGLVSAPQPWLIYNAGAVIVTLVQALLPFAVLPIYAGLRTVSPDTLEAARDLGASEPMTIWRVVLPQIQTGLFAAFAFTFLIAAGDYVTPLYLGGTSGNMLGKYIELEFSTRFNWPGGAAMSFGLLATCLGIIGLSWLALNGRRRR